MKKPILILECEEQDIILRGLELMEKRISVGLDVSNAKNKLKEIQKKIYTFQAQYNGWELYGKDK